MGSSRFYRGHPFSCWPLRKVESRIWSLAFLLLFNRSSIQSTTMVLLEIWKPQVFDFFNNFSSSRRLQLFRSNANFHVIMRFWIPFGFRTKFACIVWRLGMLLGCHSSQSMVLRISGNMLFSFMHCCWHLQSWKREILVLKWNISEDDWVGNSCFFFIIKRKKCHYIIKLISQLSCNVARLDNLTSALKAFLSQSKSTKNCLLYSCDLCWLERP